MSSLYIENHIRYDFCFNMKPFRNLKEWKKSVNMYPIFILFFPNTSQFLILNPFCFENLRCSLETVYTFKIFLLSLHLRMSGFPLQSWSLFQQLRNVGPLPTVISSKKKKKIIVIWVFPLWVRCHFSFTPVKIFFLCL